MPRNLTSADGDKLRGEIKDLRQRVEALEKRSSEPPKEAEKKPATPMATRQQLDTPSYSR